MNQQEISNLIDQKLKSFSGMFIPQHRHNRVDSLPLDPKYFLGFPTALVPDATVAPTDIPENGTFRFYYDAVPVYALWAFVNNTWVTTPLT